MRKTKLPLTHLQVAKAMLRTVEVLLETIEKECIIKEDNADYARAKIKDAKAEVSTLANTAYSSPEYKDQTQKQKDEIHKANLILNENWTDTY